MSYRGNYIPKTKKVNYKRVVPFIIILAIGVGLILGYYYKPQPQEVVPGYAFCNMSDVDSHNLVLKSNHQNAITLEDYALYGDSLSLYGDAYSRGTNDPFVGRTAFIKNICTNEEEVLLLGQGLDGQIHLANLKPGFYELRILDGFERVRLESEAVINESFYSVSLENESKHVRLIADKSLFKTEGLPELDKNYVYLDVRQEVTPSDHIDVILDPNGFYDDGTGYIYPGLVINGFHEANDLYQFTVDVKNNLTQRGIKVDIARDNKEPKSIHGEAGRLAYAYEHKAKYYIHFSMLFDTRATTKGATVIYSNFASDHFAQIMLKNLKSSGLALYDFGIGTPGIIKTSLNNGFDNNAVLRESGGRLTGAGLINDRFQNLNAYAKDYNHGINSLVVELGYASNPETLTIWNTQYDTIVESVANGIAEQLLNE